MIFGDSGIHPVSPSAPAQVCDGDMSIAARKDAPHMFDLLMLALLGAVFAALFAFVPACGALTRRDSALDQRP
jgi:hypothetical protein